MLFWSLFFQAAVFIFVVTAIGAFVSSRTRARPGHSAK